MHLCEPECNTLATLPEEIGWPVWRADEVSPRQGRAVPQVPLRSEGGMDQSLRGVVLACTAHGTMHTREGWPIRETEGRAERGRPIESSAASRPILQIQAQSGFAAAKGSTCGGKGLLVTAAQTGERGLRGREGEGCADGRARVARTGGRGLRGRQGEGCADVVASNETADY